MQDKYTENKFEIKKILKGKFFSQSSQEFW